ncbi:helix-turn-helix transcriptional regulator [Rhodovulum sp. ES.010]|uniref:helix-turn-helix domain-containing protein n=1 Tax=Rhodovulum sp. ES.010 TaxID=1882821 RepID=UPI0011152C8E|nr:helix-turn-helix transcriptional regulator [Rhodovulum sp. ES.010]
MPDSVLPVFGENLKELCALEPSVAQVARDLGLSRMQMKRFLASESFPKPNQLKRICDHFGVDARILTERLTARQIDHIARFGHLPRISDRNAEMKAAIDYVGDLSPFFPESHELQDGLYLLLTRSLLQRDTLVQANLQVKSRHGGRVVRTVLPPQYAVDFLDDETGTIPRKRPELRGIVLRHSEGFCLQFYQSVPQRVSATMVLAPVLGADVATFEGLYMIARGERGNMPRVTRCLVRRVPATFPNLLAAARRPGTVPLRDTPDDIRTALERPLA